MTLDSRSRGTFKCRLFARSTSHPSQVDLCGSHVTRKRTFVPALPPAFAVRLNSVGWRDGHRFPRLSPFGLCRRFETRDGCAIGASFRSAAARHCDVPPFRAGALGNDCSLRAGSLFSCIRACEPASSRRRIKPVCSRQLFIRLVSRCVATPRTFDQVSALFLRAAAAVGGLC